MGIRTSKGFQNLIALVMLILIFVGAYHVVMDWLLLPLSSLAEYLSGIRFENKVLLVILLLGLIAIWAFRTKQPKP